MLQTNFKMTDLLAKALTAFALGTISITLASCNTPAPPKPENPVPTKPSEYKNKSNQQPNQNNDANEDDDDEEKDEEKDGEKDD